MVVFADPLRQRRVAAADGEHLDVERRACERRRIFAQRFGPVTAAGK